MTSNDKQLILDCEQNLDILELHRRCEFGYLGGKLISEIVTTRQSLKVGASEKKKTWLKGFPSSELHA